MEPLDVGELKCVYCNAKNSRVLSQASDIRYNPNESFTICVCNSCGIMFTAPHLDEEQITKYYPSNYGQYRASEEIISTFDDNNIIDNSGLRRKLSLQIKSAYTNLLYHEVHGSHSSRWIPYLVNSFYRLLMNMSGRNYHYRDEFPMKTGHNDILYIGSGSPTTFKKIQNTPNIHLTTIDINEEMCQAYRKVGVDANYGSILSTNFPGRKFDVIYFTHVIEHLLHPKDELHQLQEWLSPHGTIVCSFPDHGSLEWRKKPIYFDVPRHRIHLTHKTAKMIFENANMKILRRLHLPYGWGFYQSRFLKRYLQGIVDKKHDFNGPIGKLDYLLSFLLAYVGQSGNVIYYLTKNK